MDTQIDLGTLTVTKHITLEIENYNSSCIYIFASRNIPIDHWQRNETLRENWIRKNHNSIWIICGKCTDTVTILYTCSLRMLGHESPSFTALPPCPQELEQDWFYSTVKWQGLKNHGYLWNTNATGVTVDSSQLCFVHEDFVSIMQGCWNISWKCEVLSVESVADIPKCQLYSIKFLLYRPCWPVLT